MKITYNVTKKIDDAVEDADRNAREVDGRPGSFDIGSSVDLRHEAARY